MSVVCVAWSSHVGALMSAASRPGMPSVRVLSSRMLEEPDRHSAFRVSDNGRAVGSA